MSERKYTDEQIVKALECCQHRECQECIRLYTGRPIEDDCRLDLIYDSLTFIKCQKAEIEKLQEVNADLNESLRLAAEANKDLQAEVERLADRSHKCIYLSDEESMEYCVDGPCPHYKTEAKIKAEAIKEFVERFKETTNGIVGLRDGVEIYETKLYQIRATSFDNLVAEMTEGK